MTHADDSHVTKRDFIYYATAGAGAVATGAAVWPLVNQMNPSADVQALSSIQRDVSALEPGQQMTVLFQGKPVFIRRQTQDEIDAALSVSVTELPDQLSRNANLNGEADAAYDNRFTPNPAEDALEGEWLVQWGVCTHLGCVPLGEAGDFGGWYCPCHGSHYDTAGRIRKGPAPENLPIPKAEFLDPAILKLG